MLERHIKKEPKEEEEEETDDKTDEEEEEREGAGGKGLSVEEGWIQWKLQHTDEGKRKTEPQERLGKVHAFATFSSDNVFDCT